MFSASLGTEPLSNIGLAAANSSLHRTRTGAQLYSESYTLSRRRSAPVSFERSATRAPPVNIAKLIGARLRIVLACIVAATTSSAAATDLPVPTIVRNALPAVVKLVVLDEDNDELASGSGFFLSPDGLLATNEHVVRGGATYLLKRPDGSFFVASKLLAVDTQNDIALLQVDAQNVPHLQLSTGPLPELGSEVIALGSPLGLEATVSTGIVSGFRGKSGPRTIQTTAAISPGSSGGPLLDRQGRVVGMTTWYLEEGQSLNFAVPSRLIADLVAAPRAVPAPSPSSQASLPTLPSGLQWTNPSIGNRFTLRQSGYYLYTESAPVPGTPLGLAERCQLKYVAGRWEGTCGVTTQVRCLKRGYSLGTGAFEIKNCSFDVEIVLTEVDPSRINGRSQYIDLFDCQTCKVQGIVWKPFVWVPTARPQN